jgi:glyoxylase-like metal-dependent hydrolase (beta-lactamase superfamily II)
MSNLGPLAYPFATPPAPGATLKVAAGLRWLRMPLPFALDHINLWLLEDGDALVAVDCGYGIDETRRHWERILAGDGRPLARVVVTHCHPDHLGLATWLAERDQAPILMTQGEFLSGHAIWHQLPGHGVADMVAQFRRHGLDDARLEALAARGNAYRRGVPSLPSSYRRLFDGDRVVIGGRDWRVICGYGHSPEHAALYCAELGVLISGDMLLPRISTNVSVFAATPEADPLGWFLDSLNRFRDLPADTLVLPSHGYPFHGIAARVQELVRHHEERCAALRAACRAPMSAGELLPTLFPRELDTHQVMFAMGEAIAHLNHLLARREVLQVSGDDGIVRYHTSI